MIILTLTREDLRERENQRHGTRSVESESFYVERGKEWDLRQEIKERR